MCLKNNFWRASQFVISLSKWKVYIYNFERFQFVISKVIYSVEIEKFDYSLRHFTFHTFYFSNWSNFQKKLIVIYIDFRKCKHNELYYGVFCLFVF